MSRKRAAILLAALITTEAFLIPTEAFLIPTAAVGNPIRSASAATMEAYSATINAQIPTGSAPADASLSTGRLPQAGSTRSAEYPSTADDYTTHSLSLQEEKLLNLINLDRAANGLPPLVADPELSRIARIKSEDMRDNNYFAHESPTWGKARQMLERFGYRFTGAGENIAHHATVEKAQAAFMTSEGHRRNILSRTWEKVGVGVCYDRNGYIYATQLFVR